METHLRNQQKKFRHHPRALLRLLRWLAHRSVQTHKGNPFADLTLVLTDDAGIRNVHARCFGDDHTTDVISLNYDPIPGETIGRSGEIFVNAECAWRNAPKPGRNATAASRPRWSATQELALYIAHGCDHLAGATDDTDEGRKRMRQRELRWLRNA
ncbi:MAG: rRNA maturation RNase YbeY, partial [Verrucomicrobia bacterium]|nr:rRNA maturation RNase YbeY [Verrucomicrobiota bacterium]